MKRSIAVTLAVLALAGSGAWTGAEARQRGGMALLDQPSGDASVQCGARRGHGGESTATFTYHVSVTNAAGSAGSVQVTYADGSVVKYPIAAGAVMHFSGVGGTTPGVDVTIAVSGVDGAELVGSMSALFDPGAKPHPDLAPAFCTTTSSSSSAAGSSAPSN